jgi:integrase
MARPRTPIGTFGVFTMDEIKPGKWRARTRFRFEDGTYRQIQRLSSSKAKAREALQVALLELNDVQGKLTRESTLAVLADRFLDNKKDRAPRTVDTYRQTIVHHIKPKIGSLIVSEATTERLGRFISQVNESSGPGAAKACRAVLSGMMGIAARSDAVRVNPIREVEHIKRRGHGAVAIPLPELPGLLKAVRGDAHLEDLDQVDVILFLAGTGCRIGEVLALRWKSLDFVKGTVTIDANVVRAHGQGIVLQDHPKTDAGIRTIAIPSSLLKLLRARQKRPSFAGDSELVFPTVLGNVRDPRNTSRDWRTARIRLGYPTVTTHSFRKTVATALDQAGCTAREIAEYLGHENPSLTQDVYMAKNTGGTRAAAALDLIVRGITN